MADLESEFPWLQDKKKGVKPMSPEDEAAAAAAEADAAAAGEFEVPPEEEEDPTVMREDDDEVFASSLRARVTKRLQELSGEQSDEMDKDGDGDIDKKDLADLRGAEDDKEGEKKEESLRDKVYRIVQETLNETDDAKVNVALDDDDDANKEDVEEGKSYKREDEEDDEQNEGKLPPGLKAHQDKQKGKDDESSDDSDDSDDDKDDKEEVEENIAANPEDFFRKLRNESRKPAKEDWSAGHKSKRSTMLNERLMKSWFK